MQQKIIKQEDDHVYCNGYFHKVSLDCYTSCIIHANGQLST